MAPDLDPFALICVAHYRTVDSSLSRLQLQCNNPDVENFVIFDALPALSLTLMN